MTKSITRAEFDTEINAVSFLIGFTRTTVLGRENFGADADGNRGMIIDTIDEDDYSNVVVSWEDADGNAHNNIPLDELPKDSLKAAVVDAIETYMQSHEPDVPEEPEYDGDDQDEDE